METVTFDGTMADQTITTNSKSFYNLVLNNTAGGGSDDIILADALDVNNDFTITNGDLDPNTNTVNITIAGDLTFGASGSLDEGIDTETITLNGAADQTITSNGEAFNDLTLINTGGGGSDDIILADALDVDGDLVITNGDLDPAENAVDITIQGDWTMGTDGSLFEGTTTETVTFDSTGGDQTITTDAEAFNNVTFNNSGAGGSDNLILVGNLDVEGDITITNGDLDQNTNNANINVVGDWAMGASGSLDSGADSETVTFDGTDQLITGTATFNNFVKSDPLDNGINLRLTISF